MKVCVKFGGSGGSFGQSIVQGTGNKKKDLRKCWECADEGMELCEMDEFESGIVDYYFVKRWTQKEKSTTLTACIAGNWLPRQPKSPPTRSPLRRKSAPRRRRDASQSANSRLVWHNVIF